MGARLSWSNISSLSLQCHTDSGCHLRGEILGSFRRVMHVIRSLKEFGWQADTRGIQVIDGDAVLLNYAGL